MASYRQYEDGHAAGGSIVVRLVRSGGMVKAFMKEVEGGDNAVGDVILPSEEMDPEEAFRLVRNKQQGAGPAEVLVELEPGVEWNPAWGELS